MKIRSDDIRKTLGSQIHEIAKILGPDLSEKYLFDAFDQLIM